MFDYIQQAIDQAKRLARLAGPITTTVSPTNVWPQSSSGLGNVGTIPSNPYSNWPASQHGLPGWPTGAFPNTLQAPCPPTLTSTDAKDLMEQYDHDGVLVKDGKLLFGVHTAHALRKVPLEYLVGLNQACRTLRRALVMEVRRRRVMEKVFPKT